MKIILASGSPRRRELLTSIGLKFEIYRPDVDETRISGEEPAEYCRRLAGLKAEAGAKEFPDSLIIAADTIVFVDGRILGKPSGREDALRMLRLLSGREHEVVTGLAVWNSGILTVKDVHTLVKFRELEESEILGYYETGECDDKAGAYAVQGKGALLIEGIQGDYYNVVGLPLCTLGKILRAQENF